MPSTKIASAGPLKPVCRCRRIQTSTSTQHDWHFSGEAWVSQAARSPGDRGRFVRVSGIVRADCERFARALAERMAHEQAEAIGEVFSVRIGQIE